MGNEELENKWRQAEETGQAVPIGPIVVCDVCNHDHTCSDECGGFIFQSKAVCPRCAPDYMMNIRTYGEEDFIRATAAKGERFADFVRRYRGPDAAVRVTTL